MGQHLLKLKAARENSWNNLCDGSKLREEMLFMGITECNISGTMRTLKILHDAAFTEGAAFASEEIKGMIQ